GLARSTITNLVNLLELTPEVQTGVRIRQISEAHAKILKGIKDPAKQVSLFKQIVAQGLSVKATEALIRESSQPASNGSSGGGSESSRSSTPSADSEYKTKHVEKLEDEMRQKLATPVEIQMAGKDKGRIVITFATNDDFMRVLETICKG